MRARITWTAFVTVVALTFSAIPSDLHGVTAMHELVVRELEPLLLSKVLTPPARPPLPPLVDRIVVGFDTEFTPSDRVLLSAQYATRVNGELVGRVYEPPESGRWAVRDVIMSARRFVRDVGVEPPLVRGVKRIELAAHFAQAEAGTVTDILEQATIRQLAGKAVHAKLDPLFIEEDDCTWCVDLIDTFAFFKTSLAKIGQAVGREKLEVDATTLAELKLTDRKRFEAYGLRDAELAYLAIEMFRSTLQADYGVDPLRSASLAAVAGEVFRHRYLSSGPAPSKLETRHVRRRSRDGTWRNAKTTARVFAGDRDVRLMATRSYWGGRCESYKRGLVVEPMVERDVVSLYPSAAILQPLPNASTRWLRVKHLDQVRDLEGFGKFEFSFPGHTEYPCLPSMIEGIVKMLFVREGISACTFSEVRAALDMGAEIRVVEAHGFVPGPAEVEHDVARYMRDLLERKAAAVKGSFDYDLYKLLVNALVGKFGERRKGSTLLEFERAARRHGFAGLGEVVSSSGALRDAMRRNPSLGSLFAVEWASLILGRARALMAPIVALSGARMISTDSILCPADREVTGPAIEALRSVGSGLPVQAHCDAALLVRSRQYALLRRIENVAATDSVLARDDRWAVIKVARGGSPETDKSYAATVLACIRAGGDVAPEVVRKRLLSVEAAVRSGGDINAEVEETGRTLFAWDTKRRLLDRDCNLFRASTSTGPYQSLGRLQAAEQLRGVRSGTRRPRRQHSRRRLREVIQFLRRGVGVREIARVTGVPRSTVSDLKRRLERDVEQAMQVSTLGACRSELTGNQGESHE